MSFFRDKYKVTIDDKNGQNYLKHFCHYKKNDLHESAIESFPARHIKLCYI